MTSVSIFCLTLLLVLSIGATGIDSASQVAVVMEQDCHRNYVNSDKFKISRDGQGSLFDYLQSTTITVVDSISVRLSGSVPTRGLTADDQFICGVNFVPRDPGFRMLLSLTHLIIGGQETGDDWLHVLDYDSNFHLSGPLASINRDESDYHSIGRGFKLIYKGHPMHDQFHITITAYKDVTGGLCEGDLYRCSGNQPFCIRRHLVCDHDENCGIINSSDESLCRREANQEKIRENTDATFPIKHDTGVTQQRYLSALVGMIVTAFIVLLVFAAVFYCYKRSHQTSRPPIMQPLSAVYVQQRAENEYSRLPYRSVTKATGSSSSITNTMRQHNNVIHTARSPSSNTHQNNNVADTAMVGPHFITNEGTEVGQCHTDAGIRVMNDVCRGECSTAPSSEDQPCDGAATTRPHIDPPSDLHYTDAPGGASNTCNSDEPVSNHEGHYSTNTGPPLQTPKTDSHEGHYSANTSGSDYPASSPSHPGAHDYMNSANSQYDIMNVAGVSNHEASQLFMWES